MTTRDDLPLDGEVLVKGDDRVHIYLGYLASDRDRCAVRPVGDGVAYWVNVSDITVKDH